MAVELNDGHPMNPMVNAGAIATTALMPGASAVEQWERVREGLSAFAGRPLSLDGVVYASEAQTNDRNRALGRLLRSYGRLSGDPDEVVDVYTRQCALSVTAHDLAVMGATLADGGVNPVTGERVVSEEVCRDTLAVVRVDRVVRTIRRLAVRVGLPGEIRCRRRHRRCRTRQGRGCRILAATGRGRELHPLADGHRVPVTCSGAEPLRLGAGAS